MEQDRAIVLATDRALRLVDASPPAGFAAAKRAASPAAVDRRPPATGHLIDVYA
jgi:hypothetical protein